MAAVRIVVTGGTGFVGKAILRALHAQHPEYELWSFDIKPPTLPLDYVTYLHGDGTVADDVDRAMAQAKPACVVATAGIVPPLAERYARRLQELVHRTNVDATASVLDSARRHGARAFVYTSSCCAVVDDMRHTYPNCDETWQTASTNSTIYGESKARAETVVLAADDPGGVRTCALRPSVLFGEDDYQLIPSVHHCIAKFETPFIIGSGLNMWDVTHVDNIADAHVLAVDNLLSAKPTAAGEAFFIGNDEPIPFRDFCREIWKNFGHYPPFEITIPDPVARAIAAMADAAGALFGLPVTLSGGSVRDAVAMRYASPDKARDILGYVPRLGIEEGLRRSCAAYQKRIDLAKKLNAQPESVFLNGTGEPNGVGVNGVKG